MNKDIWIEIILWLPIDDINSLSLVNKNYYTWCQDIYMWQQKFIHDNLKIKTPQQTICTWINEYKTIKKVIDTVNDILSYNMEILINLPSFYDIDRIMLIFKLYDAIVLFLKQCRPKFNLILLHENKLKYFVNFKLGGKYITCSIIDKHELLTDLFYYCNASYTVNYENFNTGIDIVVKNIS
jgi:hypothetical protein